MNEANAGHIHPSSFRDPSGFLFWRDGMLYRQISRGYQQHYDLLMSSGLYRELTEAGLLVAHREIPLSNHPGLPEDTYKVIAPEVVPFISYPYEWCFSQLKDAALSTLEIQRRALGRGLMLKDSSAYNIQFAGGQPTLIDTLSFEAYREGAPWIAYRQFCRHFLAPLALMSRRDIRLGQLLRVHLDGIPLDLASPLLPKFTWLQFSLSAHIHLHARSERHYERKTDRAFHGTVSRRALQALIASLEAAVKRLTWSPRGTEWAEYYDDTNYSEQAFAQKKRMVAEFLDRSQPHTVWDLGANIGEFAAIAVDRGIPCVALDLDPAAVEKNYLACKAAGRTRVLPLLVDLTNPSPAIGWANEERLSLGERGPADACLALALVHHLAISNNLPFERIATFLASLCTWLLIEFVPKTDSQVQRLLASREDIFTHYTEDDFEREFSRYFKVEGKVPLPAGARIMYTLRRR